MSAPLPLPAVPAESVRSDTIHRELNDLGERLRGVADPRELALAIVTALAARCGARSIGPVYDRSIAEVELLLGLARAASATSQSVGLWCERADRLASRFFSRVGPRGIWPWDHRVPWELATALRRACEAEPWRFLPLVVRDGRALLVDLDESSAVVDRLVEEALRKATAP